MKELLSSFATRKYVLRLLLLSGLFFLFYQFYGAIILWRYPLSSSTERYIFTEEKSVSSNFNISVISSAEQLNGNIIRDVPGVLPEYQHHYRKLNKNVFKCLQSGKVIDFSKVNDDYCDCDDFSDEPSTSACSMGKFYCHQVSLAKKPISIPSYMVNDGICDCCDGSDEWKNVSLPDHVRIPSSMQSAVGTYQVPCTNHCIK